MARLSRYPYVGIAFDPKSTKRIRHWLSSTVAGAMEAAEKNAPRTSPLEVRSAFTRDGYFWGPGNGKLMAFSSPDPARQGLREWVVEHLVDPLTENPPISGFVGTVDHLGSANRKWAEKLLRETEMWLREGGK